MAEDIYKVIVGNIGTTYKGKDKKRALADFEEFVQMSKDDYGRAAREPVYLFKNENIWREYNKPKKKVIGDLFPIGPWKYREQGEDNSFAIDKDNQWLASFLLNGEFSTVEQSSIARLLTAAPELFQALLSFVLSCKHPNALEEGELAYNVKTAEKIIKKVTGGN